MSEGFHVCNRSRGHCPILVMSPEPSVNITSIALRTALANDAAIEVVDPQPIDLGYERNEYHRMTAADYVSDKSG